MFPGALNQLLFSASPCSMNRPLALGVLRAYGQLTPERFAEMLESGLLPAPAKPAPAEEARAAVDGSCATVPRGEADETATQV